MNARKKIFLIRHCTTSWNRAVPKRVQGHADIPLDEGGIREAETLADALLPFGIKKIICSDLQRSWQTADIISKTLGATVIRDPRIRECSCGTLEGMTREEVLGQHGISVIRHWDDDHRFYDFSTFGGETRADVCKRHLELFHDLPRLSPEDRILLVGHGRGLNTLLSELGYAPTLTRGEFRIIDYGFNA